MFQKKEKKTKRRKKEKKYAHTEPARARVRKIYARSELNGPGGGRPSIFSTASTHLKQKDNAGINYVAKGTREVAVIAGLPIYLRSITATYH